MPNPHACCRPLIPGRGFRPPLVAQTVRGLQFTARVLYLCRLQLSSKSLSRLGLPSHLVSRVRVRAFLGLYNGLDASIHLAWMGPMSIESGASPPPPEQLVKALEQALTTHRTGHLQEAVAAYRDVLREDPLQPAALHCLGIALGQLREFEQALTVLAKAIELSPEDPLIRVHHGNAMWGLRHAEEALSSYDQAISLDPLTADAHSNRGKVLNELGRPELALDSLDRALALAPRNADACNTRGCALAALGRDVEALDSYDQALAINSAFTEARWNKSLVLLRQGDFREGWELHTACPEYQSPKALRRFPAAPAWDGTESLDGKILLLHADQGYGDVIQYCRYAPLLRSRGARIILEVPKPLRSLMQSLEGVDILATWGDKPPAFDLHCPFSNLPGAFRADLESIPRTTPYLCTDPERMAFWAKRLGRRAGLRAGLVWSGNPGHQQDRNRSIPLTLLAPLKDTGIEFVSLQKEVRANDVPLIDSLCRWHFDAELSDFSDTAALISQLDIVISVDTAVAHLAGALGVPVWILLPLVPDWRWMISRTDSPWYPTARLFRQTLRGQWDTVIQAVRRELRAN